MQTLQHQIAALTNRAIDTILPPRCVVTGEMVERQGMVSPKAWVSLDFIVEPFCDCCGFPFEYEVDEGSLCTSCLTHEPPFEQARAALKYNEASRDLILGFKHADKTHVVKAFMPWLERAAVGMIERANYIAPVPLHRSRLVSRRYNQSALIARAFGQHIDMPVILDALQRTRATASQGHLNAKERYKNVKRAFVVKKRRAEQVKGKSIILIDDVYTTGATAKECTKALLKVGAKEVFVLSLARVVRDWEFA